MRALERMAFLDACKGAYNLNGLINNQFSSAGQSLYKYLSLKFTSNGFSLERNHNFYVKLTKHSSEVNYLHHFLPIYNALLLHAIAMILILWSVQCVCRCPDDAVNEVFGCLETLTQNIQGKHIMAGMDTNIIKEYCRGGVFNESVDCAERIFAKCEGHKDKTILTKVANPNLWRKGFQLLCGHLELYARYDSCISEQNLEIHSCLLFNEKRYNDSMKMLDSKSKMIEDVCRYFEGINICTLNPIQRRCGMEVGTLLEDFLSSISPPLCSKGTALYNNSGQNIDVFGTWGTFVPVMSNIAIYFAITFK